MRNLNVYGEYFYGNKISAYGLEHGYVDYGTLAKAFDAVLNNDIIRNTYEIGYWEQETGYTDNTEEIEEKRDMIEELEEERDTYAGELEELAETDENETRRAYLEDKIEELEQKIDILEDAIEELEEEQEEQRGNSRRNQRNSIL